MASGRDDFVIAFRSAFLKKKDKQKFSLLTLIVLSIIVIVLGNLNFKAIQLLKTGINEIIYRSSYRGNKEMDIILGSFIREYIDKLRDEELTVLYDFLDIDDDTLYKFKNGLKTNHKIPKNRITQLFKNFNIN